MVKIGIIGCGGIARRFAQAANQVEGVRLEAVAAREEKRAEAFRMEFAVGKAYGDYDELLDEGGVDVVYVAVTHNFHYDIVEKCLRRRIPCLCEKPLTLTQKSTESLFNLAKRQDVLLMEAFWTKMQPAYIQARAWVEEGKIGTVKLIEASFCQTIPFDPSNRFYNKELAGGALYDLGVYVIQYACGLLSEYPSKISGMAHVGTTDVDEWDVITMQFPSGALASCSCGFHATTERKGRIFGTKGYIEASPMFAPEYCVRYDEDGKEVERYDGDGRDGFIYEVEHLRDLVRQGATESNLVPPRDTIECAKAFDQLNAQWGLGSGEADA